MSRKNLGPPLRERDDLEAAVRSLAHLPATRAGAPQLVQPLRPFGARASSSGDIATAIGAAGDRP